MNGATLAWRSVRHYWRTQAAVVLGVATAVAVLAGSLLVGDSVRASLSRLALSRLGRASEALTSERSFRETLAAELRRQPGFASAYEAAAPMLALRGSIARQDGARRAADVMVYGVDRRFFELHGLPAPSGLDGRGALLSPALNTELQAPSGDGLMVLVDTPGGIPGSTLFGRRDDPGRRLRLTARGALARESMGEFALSPTSQELRAVFIALPTLQRALELEGAVNTVLLAGRGGAGASTLASHLARTVRLPDLGLRLRALPGRRALSLESASSLLDDETAARAARLAREQGLQAREVLVYLANALTVGDRSLPYSLVAALDETTLRELSGVEAAPGETDPPPIVLNDWGAADLQAAPGARLDMEYYVWEEEGRIGTRSAEFRVAALVPLAGLADDRDLVPSYPGITESLHLADWEPPFPIDLSRIGPRDEEYWNRHRTTPKAFVPLAVGQRLWGHRRGRLTSLRLSIAEGADLETARVRYAEALAARLLADAPPEQRLRAYSLEVAAPARSALAAARGSTDFGQYFVYFSFFLMAAALLLAGLFFRLGVEQRLAEVGLLRAVGFTPRRLRAQFVGEGLVLAVMGALLGALGALAYARTIVWGLRTVWSGAVGTRELAVHVSSRALLLGALGGVLAAVLAIDWTVRDLRRRTPRALLAGALEEWMPAERGRAAWLPAALGALATALVIAAGLGALAPAAAFFGAGTSLLLAVLGVAARLLRGRPAAPSAIRSLAGLGLRAASFRPGRSLVCIGLVASAAFVIVAVGAFRHGEPAELHAHGSESGGFTLLATASRPLHHDPRTQAGRAALGLPDDALAGVELARFRMAAGEDASCLNLYRPARPTLLGAEVAFLHERRFSFVSSLAQTAEERADPWRLLERDAVEGALPVIADATTLRYVLHRRLGEQMSLGDSGVRVRFVGALRSGLLQSELVTSERHFQDAFPDADGYRFFLIGAPPGQEAAVAERLESHLSGFGLDVIEAAARLRGYHRVENTYIATFQTLGALGLLLGTVGLAAVLLRNAFERRRELALLQAVGYRSSHLRRLILSENALLLGAGLLAGLIPAAVAIAPALAERGGRLPLLTLAALAAALMLIGLATTWAAVGVIRRLPLLASLRSE